ncbi:MAG: hypothetical protein ACT4O4_09480 [Nitrospiraceae bacterium]
MRLLLAGMLVLLPLTAQADNSNHLKGTEIETDSSAAPPEGVRPPDSENVIDPWLPYGNPYSPTSATNFEAFALLPFSAQDGRDRSRFTAHPHDLDWTGHRYAPASPYAPLHHESPYGRAWRPEKR